VVKTVKMLPPAVLEEEIGQVLRQLADREPGAAHVVRMLHVLGMVYESTQAVMRPWTYRLSPPTPRLEREKLLATLEVHFPQLHENGFLAGAVPGAVVEALRANWEAGDLRLTVRLLNLVLRERDPFTSAVLRPHAGLLLDLGVELGRAPAVTRAAALGVSVEARMACVPGVLGRCQKLSNGSHERTALEDVMDALLR
jgi:hypothetical protein